LQELRELMNQSMLQQAAGERYTLTPLLREYAAEKLLQLPDAGHEAHERLGAYVAEADQSWCLEI